MDAGGMRSRQCKCRDDRRSSIHVDRSAERNRYRINILIETELLAELHVNRDICSRASREESCYAALADTFENERIRIVFQRNTDDQRVNYQRYNKHGNNQHKDKLPVHGKNLKTAR